LKSLFRKGQALADAIWNSRLYLPFLLLIECVAVFCNASLECMYLYVFLCVFFLVFSDDLLSVIPSVMFTLLTSVSYYKDYSVLAQYMWYAIVPFASALVFNLIFYRRKIIFGKFTLPYIAVSLALILGGAFVITKEDYFTVTALYYTLGLGAFQLVLYIMARTRLENEREYNRLERVAQILYAGGLLFVIVVFGFYIQNFEKFLEKGGVLFFKQRNFVTSVFLMVIPSVCVLVKRSNLYLIGTAFMYIAMLLSGSRSGLLFGTILLIACVVYIYITNKKSRRLYNWLFGSALIIAVAAAIAVIPDLYSARIKNAAVGDKTRIEFIKRGISHFLSHPIFGMGIGNTADLQIFKAFVPGCIVFYHNAVIQILSSMGLVGVGAYGWMFIKRLNLLWRGRKNTGIFAFALSYLGILMMSMTNPGIFCPFPEVGLLTILFAVIEKEENNLTAQNTQA
jgi:O-antigen ligase